MIGNYLSTLLLTEARELEEYVRSSIESYEL